MNGDGYVGAFHQAQRFFNGLVGEILVFDRALSDAEVAEVSSYLTNKWGR